MKRKAYVKQLNKLKNQNNVCDKEEKKETETNVNIVPVIPTSSAGPSKVPEKIPLPNVDVLMKRKRPPSPKQETSSLATHDSHDSEKKVEPQEPFYFTRSALKWQYAADTPVITSPEKLTASSVETNETKLYTGNILSDADKFNNVKSLSDAVKSEVITNGEHVHQVAVSLVSLPGTAQEAQLRHDESYGYEHHPQTATSREQEPLPPMMLSDRNPSISMDSANISGMAGMDYGMYQHHLPVSVWEQENNRYSEYNSWRDASYYHDQTILKNGIINGVNNNDSSMPNNNQHLSVPAIISDKHLSSPEMPLTRSGSGRRRRKRVQTPVQRSAANMRERRRMCHLNVAFDYLKEHLPNVKDKKKLSRIQTLKAAIYYIHLLQDSLKL